MFDMQPTYQRGALRVRVTRALIVLLAAFLCSCGPVQTVKKLILAPTATISVNSLTLTPGGSGVVTIRLDNADAVGTVSVALTYDPTLVCISDCLVNPAQSFDYSYCQTMSTDFLFQNAPNTSLVKVLLTTDAAGFTGNGVLGTLTLRSLGPVGTFDLVPQVLAFVGPSGNVLPVDIVSGSVTIADNTPTPAPTATPTASIPCCGDGDHNNAVSTAEATKAILALVNRDPASAPAAQCSVAGTITTADVTKVILNLVNRTCLGGATP